ncbi:MAG: iron-sulfur cluster repair di-iron protein [Deltaproteobacteria bacterium]
MHATTTLADFARTQPSATRVFMRHKLDFCCGGRKSLADACASRGLDADQILRELDVEARRGDDPPSWERRTQSELADHIESHYHAALRKDVPLLINASRKVERVHADKPGVPAGLADVLVEFLGEMEQHMQKEERVLFPMLRRGVRGEGVYMPVRMMESEHDSHREYLERIRGLTDDLQLPPHACATWTALYNGLAHVEAELMQHIHLENNILFSRATREG